jgi:threonine dehydrogenase-like Zn-dependent dehydrogenase
MTPDLRRAEEAVEKGCVNCRGKLYVVVEEWKDGDMVVPCPSCSAPKEKPCRRSETGWCWTHDKMCGEYDASKFCGCGYPKEHSGDCHAPKEKP